MPQRVLPSSSVLPVIGEPIGDEFVDLGQRQHLVPRRPYRHRCQRDVRIWRLLVAVSVPRRSRHLFPSRIPLNPSRLRFLPLPLDRIPLVSFLPSFFFPSHLSSTVPHIPSRSLSLSLSLLQTALSRWSVISDYRGSSFRSSFHSRSWIVVHGEFSLKSERRFLE